MNGTPIPHRAAPRMSGIPTPGRLSSIPTPGRPRSSIANAPLDSPSREDAEAMHRALTDAIKSNDPSRFRPGSSVINNASLSPESADINRRKSTGPGARGGRGAATLTTTNLRPNSAASAASSSSGARLQGDSPSSYTTALSTPVHTPGGISRSKTPLTASTRATSVYTPSNRRPESRQSGYAPSTSGRSASRLGQVTERGPSRLGRSWEVGDKVRIDGQGVEGTLRFVGELPMKPGVAYAGVELSGGFAGRGKNDGTANGVRYFECPPQCGLFVPYIKLCAPAPTYVRPQSSASVNSRSGRATPSFPFPKATDPDTPVASRTRQSSSEAAAIAAGRITAGSRASRYLNMTAKQLSARDLASQASSRAASPIRSPTRPTTSTPKTAAGRQSMGLPTPTGYKGRMSMGGVTPKAAKNVKSELPPPPSPSASMPSLSVTSTSADTSLYEDETRLESTSRAFQDRIQKLMSDELLPGSSRSSPAAENGFSFPHTPLAARHEGKLLQERIEALERENRRLAEEADATAAEMARFGASGSGALIGELEARLRDVEQLTHEQRALIDALEGEVMSEKAGREAEKEQAAEVLQAAEERVEEAERKEGALFEEVRGQQRRADELEEEVRRKAEEVRGLEGKVEELVRMAMEEREDLLSQVDELRKAGQETIALYEERLAANETVRYDLEDQIQALEEQLKAKPVRPPSPTSLARQADTAAQIDNETLREQVAHLQSRITLLEEHLEDARAERLRLEEGEREKVGRVREQEGAVRMELEAARREVERMRGEEERGRGRVEVLEAALGESDEALENARAEIEGLRSELANRHEAGEAANEGAVARPDPQEAEEVAHLKELLEAARAARQETLEQSEAFKRDADTAAQTVAELRVKLEAAEKERTQLDRRPSLELPRISDPHLSPIETRRESYSSNSSKLSRKSSGDKDKDRETRDQINGLTHMVQELQKENAALISQMKMLEADNKALSAEAEELKESLKSLEDNLEESILKEEQALDRDVSSAGAAGAGGAASGGEGAALAELKAKHEAEVEQLKKLAKKNERTIHDLNKEVAELESLVESKIYREDDLEAELEKCKEKLARLQKAPKSAAEPVAAPARSRTTSYRSPSPPEEDICELCNGSGHDVADCPVFMDGPAFTKRPNGVNGDGSPQLWCDDCESQGHRTADCPHSQDVF